MSSEDVWMAEQYQRAGKIGYGRIEGGMPRERKKEEVHDLSSAIFSPERLYGSNRNIWIQIDLWVRGISNRETYFALMKRLGDVMDLGFNGFDSRHKAGFMEQHGGDGSYGWGITIFLLWDWKKIANPKKIWAQITRAVRSFGARAEFDFRPKNGLR